LILLASNQYRNVPICGDIVRYNKRNLQDVAAASYREAVEKNGAY
jgi:hypothetical protein